MFTRVNELCNTSFTEVNEFIILSSTEGEGVVQSWPWEDLCNDGE